MQNKATKFELYSGGSNVESLVRRSKTARICALYKAYTGESFRKVKTSEEKLSVDTNRKVK